MKKGKNSSIEMDRPCEYYDDGLYITFGFDWICPSCFIPGQVLWKNADGSVAVGTGNLGVLLVDVVQQEGCSSVPASQIISSLRDRFGNKNE